MAQIQTPPFNPIKFGIHAKNIRLSKKLSIERLAKKTGLNKNTIVRFEKGLNTRMDTVLSICNALETNPFSLIEEKLVQGKDFDIKKRLRDENGNPIWRHITHKNRVKNDREVGMLIGDIDYILPGGQINAVVLEVYGKSKYRSHIGEELLFCLSGKVGLEIGNAHKILHKGDAAFFWSSEMHAYYNADTERPASIALSVWVAKEHDLSKIIYF